jgi:hypothetical protein
MLLFPVAKPCGLVGRKGHVSSSSLRRAEDGGSMFLRNTRIYLQIHMASQPIRPTSTYLCSVYSSLAFSVFCFLKMEGTFYIS